MFERSHCLEVTNLRKWFYYFNRRNNRMQWLKVILAGFIEIIWVTGLD
ncbi:QacE family quaternary ammonium compound efflux SMR transporter, partial [Ralstonia insidiosa]|nr:QacE family quaternary ammonium compound efflux SMR transporter [Ralstonia insidiosa]